MIRVVWTRPAREALGEIRSYVARLVAERIVRDVDRLRDDPLSGRVVPEVARPTLREIVHDGERHGAYRVVYRVADDEVQILAVVQGRPPIMGTTHWADND